MTRSCPPSRPISRRGFGRGVAALGGGALLSSTMPALLRAQDRALIFWDYRNPPDSDGNKYYLAAAERFKAATGIDVTVEFKSAEVIEQAVAAAANARTGFDSMVWWSGPTVRSQAYLGNVVPLDAHVPAETLAAKAGMQAMMWEGKTYAVPRTVGTYFLVYNKTLLEAAGVDPSVFPPANEPPIAWDAFLDVCEKVKASGVAPLMFANREGYFNEWYFYNFIAMGFDSSEPIADIGAGVASWQQEPIYDALNAYKQLYDAGYFVEGGDVVAYEQHVRQMGGGQCAMSVYFDPTGGATGAIAESYGAEAVGLTRVPNYRTDTGLYGHSSLEPDAVYVASFSDRQDDALAWLNHLVSLDEVNEMVSALQLAPADRRFDPTLISDPQLAALYQGAAQKGHVYPYTFVTQAQYADLLENGILFLRGEMSAQELCAGFDAVDKEYRDAQ